MDEDTEFLLKRASEEATLAINAESEASEVHQEMAVRYSAKAMLQLGDGDGDNACLPSEPLEETGKSMNVQPGPPKGVGDHSPNPLPDRLSERRPGDGDSGRA